MCNLVSSWFCPSVYDWHMISFLFVDPSFQIQMTIDFSCIDSIKWWSKNCSSHNCFKIVCWVVTPINTSIDFASSIFKSVVDPNHDFILWTLSIGLFQNIEDWLYALFSFLLNFRWCKLEIPYSVNSFNSLLMHFGLSGMWCGVQWTGRTNHYFQMSQLSLRNN